MKKRAIISVICIILMLAGCGKTHEHALTEWKGDATEHWYICECGEKLDSSAHTFDEYNICSVCGIAVTDMGDGAYELITYDEQGAIEYLTGYDAQGNVLYEQHVDN